MERCCIDELLRRIDGRKVRDEACVGSEGENRKDGGRSRQGMAGETTRSNYGERMRVL